MTIRWGVLGAGDASHRFAEGLRQVEDAALGATWTRRPAAAATFASVYGGASCATLEALLGAPTDAVYLGTHPDSHRSLALAALRAGKHVLCEKPSMLNGRELDEVLAVAVEQKLLFMEAMKPPFFPLYQKLRAHLEQDPIGQVGFVRAGSSLADVPLSHSLYSKNAGGGGLLGIMPYEAFLALDWLGPVTRVQTLGQIGPSGVDTFCTLQTEHAHGYAQLYCGLGLHGHGDALLAGPLGHVAIAAKWWNPEHAVVRYLDGRIVELHEPIVSSGFNYETDHFCELLRAGKRESTVMTHAMSRGMMQMLDSARSALGLVFPHEASDVIRGAAGS